MNDAVSSAVDSLISNTERIYDQCAELVDKQGNTRNPGKGKFRFQHITPIKRRISQVDIEFP
jgi:hypothetical protein